MWGVVGWSGESASRQSKLILLYICFVVFLLTVIIIIMKKLGSGSAAYDHYGKIYCFVPFVGMQNSMARM